MGGHTNFIVNQTRIPNTISWIIRVPVMLTAHPFPTDPARSQPEGMTFLR